MLSSGNVVAVDPYSCLLSVNTSFPFQPFNVLLAMDADALRQSAGILPVSMPISLHLACDEPAMLWHLRHTPLDMVILAGTVPAEVHARLLTLARLPRIVCLGDEALSAFRGYAGWRECVVALPCPVSTDALHLQIQACMRQASHSAVAGTRLSVDNLSLDPARSVARIGGMEVYLTAVEMDVLAMLVRHANMLVSREQLGQIALGPGFMPKERRLDTHVSNLRRKLRARFSVEMAHLEIRSFRGRGYALMIGERLVNAVQAGGARLLGLYLAMSMAIPG